MSVDRRQKIVLEKLLEKVGSMYKLVILAAKRALELSEGSPKLVEASPREKPGLIALREIAEERVSFRLKKEAKG